MVEDSHIQIIRYPTLSSTALTLATTGSPPISAVVSGITGCLLFAILSWRIHCRARETSRPAPTLAPRSRWPHRTPRRRLIDVSISSFLFLQCELLCQKRAFLAIASTAPDFIMLLSSMMAVPYNFSRETLVLGEILELRGTFTRTYLKLERDALSAPLGQNSASEPRYFQGFCMLLKIDAPDFKWAPNRK